MSTKGSDNRADLQREFNHEHLAGLERDACAHGHVQRIQLFVESQLSVDVKSEFDLTTVVRHGSLPNDRLVQGQRLQAQFSQRAARIQ